MKIEYMGKNEEKKYREGFISYDEDKEQEKADKVFSILRDKGYEILEEQGTANIIVYDRDEYEILVADYKEAKKVWKRK